VISKGFLGTIAGGVGVVIAFLVITTSGLLQPPQDQQFVTKDVVLNLKSVSVVSANEEEAVIEVAFDAFNPNRGSVILESVRYNLHANGIRIASSEIGERAEGFLASTGKTFTMYSEFSMTLKDKVEVKRIEPFTQVWDDLQNDNVQWRVTGTFVVTDPVRTGGNEVDFDFAT